MTYSILLYKNQDTIPEAASQDSNLTVVETLNQHTHSASTLISCVLKNTH